MMNTIKLFVLTISMVGLFACDAIVDRDNNLSANLNGNDFTATLTTGIKESGVIVITGVKGTESLVVGVAEDVTSGDYDLISGKAYTTYITADQKFSITTSGKVSIIEHNTEAKTIEGTFNGVMQAETDSSSTTTISNGKFYCTYKEI
ncbi:MAG: hypothetical protein KDC92_01855 [Bacteroidetes bacterium]|nr:hypothetical protein [Bacteroidota bacterium]